MKHDNGMTCTGVPVSNYNLRQGSRIDPPKGYWQVTCGKRVTHWNATQYSIEYLREYFPKAKIRRVRSLIG